MEFEEAKKRVGLVLKDFAPVPEELTLQGMQYGSFKPERDEFPVPELVLFTFEKFLGVEAEGPWEKTRWGVYALYKGVFLGFEFRKFGLTVLVGNFEDSFVREALGKVKKVIKIVEDYLDAFAGEQARSGHVSVANMFHDFDNAYRFFREKAQEAYGSPDVVTARDGKGIPVAWTLMEGQREGSYYAMAMLDAFFSRLEHLLVLVLPFVGISPGNGMLVEFVCAQWGEKFKKVFDLEHDKAAKVVWDRLKFVKEKYRNTLSHGGFEKGGASLYFHLPGVGALPASLSRHKDSIHFNFIPIGETTYDEVCALLDEVDAFLDESHTSWGMRFVRSGLDVNFDPESRAEYESAMSSEEEFERLIERLSHRWERHANMDY